MHYKKGNLLKRIFLSEKNKNESAMLLVTDVDNAIDNNYFYALVLSSEGFFKTSIVYSIGQVGEYLKMYIGTKQSTFFEDVLLNRDTTHDEIQ